MTENQTTPSESNFFYDKGVAPRLQSYDNSQDKSKDDALVATLLDASMFGNLNGQTQAKAAVARAKRKRLKNSKRKQK